MTLRNPRWIKVGQTVNIDTEVIWRHTLAMKRVDAAYHAEIMPRCPGMKLVFGEELLASKQPELTFMHLDHERISATAN